MKALALIYDDEDKATEYQRQVQPQALAHDITVRAQGLEDLTETLGILEDRRRAARDETGTLRGCLLDKADLVFVDYDLLRVKGFVSGENFAYLARCYSECGYIVGLNQSPDLDFDLTLNSDLDSFADLNINEKHLPASGLWRNTWSGFRPWHWPLLPATIGSFRKRVAALRKPGALDMPVLDLLGLRSMAPALPRTTAQFLGHGSDLDRVSGRTFVEHSGNALRGKDRPLGDSYVARVAAARLSKWLERLLLPAQDILIDAPHLVSRFPSLLKSSKIPPTVDAWNRTARLEIASELGMQSRAIEIFRFKKREWLSREAWLWPEISASDKIKEVRNPWPAEHLSYVFCEDTSRFVTRGAAHEFVAEVPSSFVRRFVAKVQNDVNYGPAVRFAM